MRGASSSVSRDQQTPPPSAITYIDRQNVDDTRRSSSHRCQSQIVVETRDFFHTQLAFDALVSEDVGILPQRLVWKN